MIILQIASDTLVVKSISVNGSSSGWTPQLTTAIVAVLSATFGTIVTIFVKRTEFKFQKQEIDNQRRLIDDTIKNNQNLLKAEVVRLKQLRKDYELNLNKHNYDKLKQVLDFAETQNKESFSDKVKAIKSFNEFLIILDKNRPPDEFFEDSSDFNEWISKSTYKNLNLVSQYLESFVKNYMHVYPDLSDNLKKLQKKADSVKFQIEDLKSNSYENEHETFIILQFSDDLLEIRNSLDKVLTEMKMEFKELEQFKKDFIKSQIGTT